jgi:hypothetical protein
VIRIPAAQGRRSWVSGFTQSACPTGKTGGAGPVKFPYPLYGAILHGALINPEKTNFFIKILL